MALKNSIVSNFIWRFLERSGAQLVTVVVSIVLARLLEPGVYGAVALITIITAILQVFLDAGLSVALIQKKDADDIDFSSVFYFNIIISILLYYLLFVSAPTIANFYRMPELAAPIRVLGLTLLIFALKSVQQSYVARNMMFRKFFFSTSGGTIGAAIVGIWMACNGYGIWALIIQNLFNMTVDTAILWITVKWRPRLVFSWNRLSSLLGFGWKLLVSGLLDTISTKLMSMIIGKMYTAADLAFFNKGEQFPSALVQNINISIDSVLLPTMSNVQDDVIAVKDMTRRAIKVSTYCIMPMMMGLTVCARSLVVVLLTEKWLPCVPFLRIACLSYAFYSVHTTNLNAIKALGHSDIFLKLEAIKKILGLVVVISTMWWGPLAMAYGLLFASIASQAINAWPNKKLLEYGYWDQLKDMLPQILASCLMGITVSAVSLLGISNILTLCIQIPTGIVSYVVYSKVFHIDSYEYVIKVLRESVFNKKM